MRGRQASRSCNSGITARTSFRRHEPPKAKPGFKYSGEIFSLLSIQTISITRLSSTFKVGQAAQFRFAKETLSAWKMLHTYFTEQAVPMSVYTSGDLTLL